MIHLLDIIENVGFPILACIFLFKQNQMLTQSISDLRNTLSSIDKRIENLEKEVDKYVKDK